ncbi:hypothetical protein [Streptacidiphilus fuscans]|uniref:Uncharacterized protein n=1 Tax=Streptacidiphilus fuscans TaxID=2789292 RepID=A0A931B557_9ACTN|nr:hypothetical protein [Streptacidiphilus fuscans]MBF9069592.1 hypothetical protein [Streptacidiphilus fuscans]
MSDPVSLTGAEHSAPAEMCTTCASSVTHAHSSSTSAAPLAAFIPAQRSRAPRIDVSVFQADRASYSLRRFDAVDVLTRGRIGEALGITRQSAWERFSGEE